MVESDPAALAEAWIAYWTADPTARLAAIDDVNYRAWVLCQDEPEKAFAFVLEVLRRTDSHRIIEVLSAGPLEDILAKHGEKMIDRVEAEARSNPAFATLLGGGWQNDMSDEVWRRVQTVWDRRGWDGTPETNHPDSYAVSVG